MTETESKPGWHLINREQVLRRLDSDSESGLSDAEVARRRQVAWVAQVQPRLLARLIFG